MMNVRITGSLATLVLVLGITARADGQSLSTGAATVIPPLPLTLPALTPPPARALFGAAQIVDRPTADLRSRFHWGVFGSFVPMWSIPGGMGNLFFENPNTPKMRGKDLRVGVVRGRQLGFEIGASLVRKTVTSLNIGSYTAPNPVTMMGADGHILLPLRRFGERAQLGFLAGGGLAWLPDTPIQVRIEGPPYFASASMTTPLSTPPATGGFVQTYSDRGTLIALPLVPGTAYALGEATLYDVSPTDNFWMLLRGQLVADFLLATPLKLRLTTGFNYPGLQAVGIDAVYLFRTGRGDLDPTRGAPRSATPGQIVDQPDVLAPRQSYWGVIGGLTPRWWNPDSWGKLLDSYDPTNIEGREFRVGVTRGRPLGYEFGVSFVRKSIKPFTYQRIGYTVNPITLTSNETIQIPGVEFHAFVPISRIGSRVQLGAVLGGGAAPMPDAAIQKRIPGPPYYATASQNDFAVLSTPPAGGGFVEDERQQRFPVAPGQTEGIATVDASDISPYGKMFVLMRGEIAADVLVARPLKFRFSGGFNSPGAHLFNVEAVYMFGTGGN